MNAAMRMFQGRLWKKSFHKSSEDTAIFIFNSVLWDINRLADPLANPLNQTAEDFYSEWRVDYTSKVIELLRLVRPGKDELVLQNMH